MGKGLFQYIRDTTFTKFFVTWIISIIIFGLIYFISSNWTNIIVNEIQITFTITGFFNAIYSSILIAIIFGIGLVEYSSIAIIVYIQLLLSGILILILADKLIQKYIHPSYHETHHQDKKINTLMLMMSVFRTDVDRLMHSYAAKNHSIKIKDIEAIIDGLYVVFLDVEKLFSEKNLHKHKIKTMQYLMLTENIEDSLHKLEKFIKFMEKHNIAWKDNSTEFWMKYILNTANSIARNIEGSDIKSHKVILAVENIKQYAQDLQEKI
ncbi:MAG: hypothetical protein ACP5NV_00910 [Candidatus Woesearchaeota archaeon]